jgi:hypothetical protein
MGLSEYIQKYQNIILAVWTLGMIIFGISFIVNQPGKTHDPNGDYTFDYAVIVIFIIGGLVEWLFILISLFSVIVNQEYFYIAIILLILILFFMVIMGMCQFFNTMARSNGKKDGYLAGVYIGIIGLTLLFFGLIFKFYFNK